MLLNATETLSEHYTSAQQRTDQNHRKVCLYALARIALIQTYLSHLLSIQVVQLGSDVALAAKEVNDQYITDATRLMGEINRQRDLLGEWTTQATNAYTLRLLAENKKAEVKIDDADVGAILVATRASYPSIASLIN